MRFRLKSTGWIVEFDAQPPQQLTSIVGDKKIVYDRRGRV
jgi:hypothetical protein